MQRATTLALALAALIVPAAGHPALAANFLDIFEYKLDVDAKELFQTQEVRDDLLVALHARQFDLSGLKRQVAGFDISASQVTVQVTPSRADGASTRLALDIAGSDVEIAGPLLDKKFDTLKVSDVYGVYNAGTDKVTIHVPFATALSLMFR